MSARPLPIDLDLDVDGDDNKNLQSLLSEQRRELMTTLSLESDFDMAFQLQLQEAMNASLSLVSVPSTSSPPQPRPPTPPQRDSSSRISLKSQELELSKLQQELADREYSLLETRKLQEDINRRIHDQNFAREVLRIEESDWEEWGDNFEKPFCEEASSSSSSGRGGDDPVFRVYFKGLISEEKVSGSKAGIGVAICDPADNLVLEIGKPLSGNGMNRTTAEAKALIEGLNAALSLDMKRIVFYCDHYPLYQFVIGRWAPKQRKVEMLVDQVTLLQKKFTYCNAFLMARNDIKYAFKLAKDAMVSPASAPSQSSLGRSAYENCVICLEDTDVSRVFSVDGCHHRYCFSCMKQHVEVKLLHGIAPKCPHEGCKSELGVDSCTKFLPPKLIEMMRLRIKEDSIPVTEKIYCPYPKCSVLMSKSEVSEHNKAASAGVGPSSRRECVKCHGFFCFYCKVPWHSGMTCDVYRRLHQNPSAPDAKLKSLATRNLWRQCVKCNHMIELAEGCYHMTCRCGFEFCYNCGAEWKNKKATCSCPLWDEENIWYDETEEESDEEYSDEDDFYDDEDGYLL